MTVENLVILLEEPSAKKMLDVVVPKRFQSIDEFQHAYFGNPKNCRSALKTCFAIQRRYKQIKDVEPCGISLFLSLDSLV